MKKALLYFALIYLGLAMLGGVFAIFDPASSNDFKLFSLVIEALLALLFYLCFRALKRFKAAESLREIGVEKPTLSATTENGFVHQKKGVSSEEPRYSREQIENEQRIFNDCVQLVQTTKNLDVFLSRYDLLLQKASFLDATIHTTTRQPAIDEYPQLLELCVERNIAEITKLKTTKGRASRIADLLERLKLADVYSDTCGQAIGIQFKRIERLISSNDPNNSDSKTTYTMTETRHEPFIAVVPTDMMGELDVMTTGKGQRQTVDSINSSQDQVVTSIKLNDTRSHTSTAIAARQADDFAIHPDLVGLIWIADGPMKNIDMQGNYSFTNEFMRISFSTPWDREPSAIETALPISEPYDTSNVPKLGYYPSYVNLTPEQRWMYLLTLSNPYNPTTEIGYIFVLYYGLERHLLTGDFDRAFSVITKLRDVHDNHSFRGYSADSLIIASILRGREDKLRSFLEASISGYAPQLSEQLRVIVKAQFGEELTAAEIIRSAKGFGFTNNRYIKAEPVLFEQTMQELLDNEYPNGTMPIAHYLGYDLPKTQTLTIANISFRQRTAKIPNLFDYPPFVEEGLSLLKTTHETVKLKLRNRRKYEG